MEDFYDLLEVSEDASTEEIDRAWRRKVRTYHPDVNDDTRASAQFKTLKKAHEVLSDETERAAYDRMGHRSYVQQRLDGLPTKIRSRRADATSHPDATAETDATEGTEAETDQNTTTDESTTSRTDARASAGDRSTDRRKTADRGATERTRTQNSRRSRRSKRSDRGESARGSAVDDRRTGRTSTSSGGQRTTGSGATDGTGTAEGGSKSATATRSGRRSPPLLYGWTAVLLAGVVYVAGLWQYLRANAGALSNLRRTAAVDPAAALTATHELVPPGQFVLESATVDAPVTLLLPIGTVALAITLVVVVHSFGRGVAYLYALGGLVPLLTLASGPIVTLPDGVVLVLVCVCPLIAIAGFLVDVGRVLF